MDPDWVIRWCVSEKLGDIGDSVALGPLLDGLGDSDFHVRKNIMKAIEKFEARMVPQAVCYFKHENVLVRRTIHTIFSTLGEKIVPALRKEMGKHGWVVDNFILYMLCNLNSEQEEEILKEALTIPTVQKNAIIFLGLREDPKIIPRLIKLYEKPSLRRLILYSIKLIGKRQSFSFIVRLLNHPSLCDQSVKIIVKIGPPILPHLIIALAKPGFSKSQLVHLIGKIGPEKVMDKLCILATKDPEIDGLISSLKERYPHLMKTKTVTGA